MFQVLASDEYIVTLREWNIITVDGGNPASVSNYNSNYDKNIGNPANCGSIINYVKSYYS